MKKYFRDYNLDSKLLQAIDDCGYRECTAIQAETLPILLKGENCFIQSKTGSGKTAAFCIPLIQSMSFEDTTKALILAPTRELAKQIQQEFNRLSLYKKLNCVCLVGKEDFQKQRNQLRQKAHVIVGTPGRILDHLQEDNIQLDSISTLILDEATEMFSLGLVDQLKEIIYTLPHHKTWLFSATLDDTLDTDFLNVSNPVTIQIDSSHEISSQIDTFHIETNNKLETLNTLLHAMIIDSCCVFVNTREDCEMVAKELKKQNYLVSMLHGGMDQKQRNRALESFKKGNARLLVSTDVAARGIDVDDVSLVLHYDCPNTLDSYIHRSGRTGRKNASGCSITLLSKHDTSSLFDTIKYETETYKIASQTFENNLHKPTIKIDKNASFKEKNITLFIRAGKKDKIRNLDIVGALCSLPQLEKDNVGIIDVQDNYSIVSLLEVDPSLIEELSIIKIKGKNRKAELKIQ